MAGSSWEAQRRWREKNPERHRENQRRYYHRHKEETREDRNARARIAQSVYREKQRLIAEADSIDFAEFVSCGFSVS